jgi:hypothetical protein
MAILPIEIREQYVGYAEYCVQLAKKSEDFECREVLRSMAAEWLRLADSGDH